MDKQDYSTSFNRLAYDIYKLLAAEIRHLNKILHSPKSHNALGSNIAYTPKANIKTSTF